MANLIDLREASGHTQEGLASLIGVSRETVRCWEIGSWSPRAGRLAPLAQALDVSIADVYQALAETVRLSAYEL